MKMLFASESADLFDILQGAFKGIVLSYFFSALTFFCDLLLYYNTLEIMKNSLHFVHGILTTLVNIQDKSFHILGRHTLNHFSVSF